MPEAIQKQREIPPPDPLICGLHFRGRLPHLMKEGTVYFVTFRLADSLPAREIARLKHERQAILETGPRRQKSVDVARGGAIAGVVLRQSGRFAGCRAWSLLVEQAKCGRFGGRRAEDLRRAAL